jgi:hypothetical protein
MLTKKAATQKLVAFTVALTVPTGLPPEAEDHLCNVLDLIDLPQRIKSAVSFIVAQNKVLSKFVTQTTVEE